MVEMENPSRKQSKKLEKQKLDSNYFKSDDNFVEVELPKRSEEDEETKE